MWHSNSSFAGRKEKHAFFNGNKIRYILFYILKKTASSFCALWNWQRANMLCIYFPHSYIRNLGKPENREELLQYLMWPNIKISATWYHGSTPFTAEPWRARFFFLNQGVHYFFLLISPTDLLDFLEMHIPPVDSNTLFSLCFSVFRLSIS